MARSLKTKYLLLALAVGAVLSLLLGGLAYYEHRVDTADVNQLTYATVAQKLEADLETRASSLSEITGTSLAPALASGNKVAIASIAERLLDERDIERVEVLDAHGTVLFQRRRSRSATIRRLVRVPKHHSLESGFGAGAACRHAADLDEPRRDAARRWRAYASSWKANRACRSNACAACSPASPCRCCFWGCRRLVHRPPAGGADRGAGQERGPHRRGRLHPAARGGAPR